MRALMARDRAVDNKLLRQEVGPAYDALKGSPRARHSLDEVLVGLKNNRIARFNIRSYLRQKRAVIALAIGVEQVFILSSFYGGQDYETALQSDLDD